MKIAFVTQPFEHFPSRGGAVATWTQEVGTRLAREHDVTVYCRTSPSRRNEEQLGGLSIRRCATHVDERIGRIFRFVDSAANRVDVRERRLSQELAYYKYYYFRELYYRSFIKAVSRRMSRSQVDVVVIPNFSQFVPIVRSANPQAKIMLRMSCDWLIELSEKTVERRLRQVDAVFGVSGYISQGIARRFPQHASKCHRLHNGCNLTRFKTSFDRDRVGALKSKLGLDGRRVVLFTGRVCPEKGVHVLVAAMKRVVAEMPDVTLLIVGGAWNQPPSPLWINDRSSEFREFDRLRRVGYLAHLQRESFDIANNVHFAHSVPQTELADYYNLADVFVHPSVWQEPLPQVLTEAMACALPVVSTAVGGNPELVVNGETGLLVPPDDPDSLAAAILRLCQDESMSRNMGLRGRQRVEQSFTWDQTAQIVTNVLGDLYLEPASGNPTVAVSGGSL